MLQYNMFYVKGGTKTQRELTENVAMFAIKNLFPKMVLKLLKQEKNI